MQLSQFAESHLHLARLRPAPSERGRQQIVAHVAPMAQILRDLLTEGINQRYLPEQDLDTLIPLISAATAPRATVEVAGPAVERVIDAAVPFVLRGVGARLGPGHRPRRLPGR